MLLDHPLLACLLSDTINVSLVASKLLRLSFSNFSRTNHIFPKLTLFVRLECNTYFMYAIRLGLVLHQHRICVTTRLVNSKVVAFGLFRFVLECFEVIGHTLTNDWKFSPSCT